MSVSEDDDVTNHQHTFSGSQARRCPPDVVVRVTPQVESFSAEHTESVRASTTLTSPASAGTAIVLGAKARTPPARSPRFADTREPTARSGPTGATPMPATTSTTACSGSPASCSVTPPASTRTAPRRDRPLVNATTKSRRQGTLKSPPPNVRASILQLHHPQ